MAIRVIVVDDHGVLREGLRLLIEQREGLELVGEAEDGRKAVEIVAELKPDIVLMDVSMPGLNGIEAARQILHDNNNVKVLALSAYSNKRFVTEMLKLGASGYILKDSASSELVRAIETIAGGDNYLCPKAASLVIEDYKQNSKAFANHSPLDGLTAKERELLQLLAEGISTKEAARLLSVSVKTTDARRRETMNKLGISSMAELTKFAIREGLTSLEF
jgi:two-component system response regulator NreC